MMKVSRYEASRSAAWDEFVAASRNGTFLLMRGYMDYHADRFHDHSLLFENDRGELVAVLPANVSGDAMVSHGGLTYGGFVTGARMTAPAMLECFEALLAYLRASALRTLRYKTIPHIYASHPADEDRYALFRANARLYRRDVLAVVLPSARLPYQERRVRRMKKAAKSGVSVEERRDLRAFWAILEDNLRRAHGVAPVHSIEEIELLASRFPRNIRLHLALEAGEPVAGAVMYDTGRVAHVQYIASSERAREIGALDLLFASLIEEAYASSPYFDFGISTEEDGMVLNVGLMEQKEGFGARSVAHDFYEVAVP
jgi:hypothetical protein